MKLYLKSNRPAGMDDVSSFWAKVAIIEWHPEEQE